MKVLIIGFGSIGKRHFEILSAFNNISSIDVVTKQSLESISSYQKLEDIENLSVYADKVLLNKEYKLLYMNEKRLNNIEEI